MTEIDQLIAEDPELWLGELPAYQQSGIRSMLKSGMSYDVAAAAWLSGAVADNTAPFSGGVRGKVFYDAFLDQMHDFLCTGISYEEERAALMAGFKPKQAGLTATIAAAIAPHLGAASTLIAPAVALALCAIGKMGLGAWCQVQTARRNPTTGDTAQSDDSNDGATQ
ncbi:hypothetical protein ACFTY8_23090 [Streptomyces mirabilis]|uniref:hypothetical protein n=1 Tax=Streptomyces mirabilis TaxID=68239 RepID=UPI0036349BE5